MQVQWWDEKEEDEDDQFSYYRKSMNKIEEVMENVNLCYNEMKESGQTRKRIA
jgi:hypothetical protein